MFVRICVVNGFLVGLLALTAVGCGGNETSGPSADEVSNFVEENPEMMEETKQFQADPMDDSFE